ncbi:MAG: hypothetical protein IKT96_04880, partial [Paludibacteraceae bacterium]|nr:hypothetical protein [Paludibacteraceae bacterium]
SCNSKVMLQANADTAVAQNISSVIKSFFIFKSVLLIKFVFMLISNFRGEDITQKINFFDFGAKGITKNATKIIET